ncbi:MAG: FKBP-type peptidyl-prolyl cis-trans isomerase [Caulobacteraceae bacterium]|nr:FKBP-type peptidyl-prolyl cis-trans isomerase [Caulobacteraceae bacterium]
MQSGWVRGALAATAVAGALASAGCGKIFGTPADNPPQPNPLEELMRQAQQQQLPPADAQAQAAFLATNARVAGVKSTASGLQYRVERSGPRNEPPLQDGDVVKVAYAGTLIDGTPFDSNENAEFTVGQLVPGFNEAMKLMRVGDSWTIWLPADIAYGDQPPPGSPIPPGSVLIFKLEILSRAGGATANG